MGRFLFKSLLMVIFLAVGVLIGMNRANQGMNDMRGYTDSSFQTPVHIQTTDEGSFDAAVLGNEISSFNMNEKKEKLEEVKSFNFFSEIGKLLADLISSIAQAIINFFAGLF
ncbi:DUF3679 domain-containing protein [Lederbergia galactosidilytica]|uniref:DUF3679 domain-containing protein n=1 Tax=Lederbergia galactosidilytica TaxID=217031 RepID=A0A178A3R8_9BACI|nr:DUF3679 domain-containing protein [Lederbergia galactosidilytica]KRG15532.1 hypothetical protein ACA30_05405 [Virgibacillus soli]MBP1914838.1 hypothetical protein [Lederbergia galactosidilytica]OAK74734.1 hypothetical protein ABB05_03985 [Lederbergia galactosidilytica]